MLYVGAFFFVVHFEGGGFVGLQLLLNLEKFLALITSNIFCHSHSVSLMACLLDHLVLLTSYCCSVHF